MRKSLFHLMRVLAMMPVFVLACTCPCVVSDLRAANGSDAAALAAIIGDAHLSNGLELHRQIAERPLSAQYVSLRDYVFPPGRQVIRIDLAFSPAHIAPNVADAYGISRNPWSAFHPELAGRREVGGGEPLLPAVTLVQVAKQLGRLSEVANLVESRSPLSDRLTQEQRTMRVLLAIALGDFDAAHQQMLRFTEAAQPQTADATSLGPVTCLIWTAGQIPELRGAASDLAFRYYDIVRSGQPIGSECWRRHLFSLTYLLQWLSSEQAAISSGASEPLARWHPVTRTTAVTNGQGYPIPSWQLRRGIASSVTGHDHDYLYYQIPVTGDFAIEADLSGFGYGDTRLGFGGVWAGPAFDHRSILNGDFRDDREPILLDRPLDEIGTSMAVRIVVADGRRTTYVNGRAVFKSDESASDPWLSIFSYWYTHGWVKNLRITGDVQIPSEIDLIGHSGLPGWASYYGESVAGRDADWWLSSDSDGTAPSLESGPVLRGGRSDQPAGAAQESLIRYHRPVLEDANISYEFFYREGEFGVHPALDRRAFLLSTGGVADHWITDGRYERTELHPSNATRRATDQRGEQPLPLKPDRWNRIELQISGDAVVIRLNDQTVFESLLANSNLRTFGLFHYADRTEARVRNLRWRGAWPKSLPATLDQELADAAVEDALSGRMLSERFQQDFADGEFRDKFLTSGPGWAELERRPQGIRIARPGRDHYVADRLIPQVRLEGDFDIIAEYEGLDLATAEGGDSNIHLSVTFEQDDVECLIYRKFSRFEKKELGQQMIQAAYFHTRQGERSWTFPRLSSEASAAGKLRLVRRQDRLFYLHASGDSSVFRLLHTETVPTGPVVSGNLRLCLESTKVGRAEVTWKSLAIAAEGVSGLATRPSLSLAELDRTRSELAAQAELDFADPMSGRHFRQARTDTGFVHDERGLLLTAPGFDNWVGHAVLPNVSLTGDFDVALDLEVKKLVKPAAGGESTAYVEIEFRDPMRTAIETKFAISEQGQTGAEIQLRRLNAARRYDYQELVNIPMESVCELRLARRNGIAYFVARSSPEEAPTLLGRLEVANHPVRVGDLRIMVHTGGEGRETVVLLKKLTIQAQSIESSMLETDSAR